MSVISIATKGRKTLGGGFLSSDRAFRRLAARENGLRTPAGTRCTGRPVLASSGPTTKPFANAPNPLSTAPVARFVVRMRNQTLPKRLCHFSVSSMSLSSAPFFATNLAFFALDADARKSEIIGGGFLDTELSASTA